MKIVHTVSEIVKKREIDVFIIDNERGLEISVMTLGATLISVKQADRNGIKEEITLGFDKPSGYLVNRTFFGATIGRFGNRIAEGKFTLGDKKFSLAVNNGPNHLHGGIEGFNRKFWKAEIFEKIDRAGVIFTLTSPDGEEGYPGTLDVEMKYTLTSDGRLKFSYIAVTDKETVINLTNHAYWNLAGAGSGPISEQTFFSPATHYLPVDKNLIPTGELKAVAGTPFDFREEKSFAEGFSQLEASEEYKAVINPVEGFDHCFVLPGSDRESSAGAVCWAGTFTDWISGRQMEVFTDQAGFQLFTCGSMGKTPISDGRSAGKFGAFCVETQTFPDAPNHPTFPSAVLKKGETYSHKTVHRFSLVEDSEG